MWVTRTVKWLVAVLKKMEQTRCMVRGSWEEPDQGFPSIFSFRSPSDSFNQRLRVPEGTVGVLRLALLQIPGNLWNIFRFLLKTKASLQLFAAWSSITGIKLSAATSFLVIRYTVLSWTICLLVISRVWLSMFFFAFETVGWKLSLSLRSLILKMWSLDFWCISRVDLWRLLQPVVVKGFLLPVDLQIWQPCKFFQPSRQKMPLIFNELTRLGFRIRHVFSIYFLSQNASQWDISSQASARSFNRNIRKASSITIQSEYGSF